MRTADRLISELNYLGLHFLVGETSKEYHHRLSPATILAGLAGHTDARLRMALTALLLYQPSIAQAIPEALKQLNKRDQKTLKLNYTAAVFLQQINQEPLQKTITHWQILPDLFSQELGIPDDVPPQRKLHLLSELHRKISGLSINWIGTYQYTVKRLISRLEKEAVWIA
jgi:hypothetical protein